MRSPPLALVRPVANARSKGKGDSGRDPGGFVALPWTVLDSVAYMELSHPAKALLLEVARQFHADDNGRMLLSEAYLRPRGWKSADVINRAKRELLDAGLIFQTVQGHRPNKASWYAVTWRRLDRLPGFDPGTEKLFERGAYRPMKNAVLTPARGARGASIAPSPGAGNPLTTPSPGAIRAVFGPSSTPSRGDPLEMPSIGTATQH